MIKTAVTLAGVELKNPVMTASGTFGSGAEYSEFIDLNKLGAVVTKGVANVPWPGNPTPRVAETASGMLNAIGLQNPGIDVFCERDIPFLKKYDTKIIVNVCGKSTEDYCEVVERLGNEPVDLLEINVSCPNVKEGGIAFGQDPKALEAITKEVKKYAKQPIIMKLSPNVTDITEMAKAAEAGGADILSLINTLTGMKIDIYKKTFALANKTGGMSGPAVKPVAVRMVYQVAQAVKLPIIGMGGISTAEDALEFILAGASAVSVGTANFFNPYAAEEVVRGIEDYMKSQKRFLSCSKCINHDRCWLCYTNRIRYNSFLIRAAVKHIRKCSGYIFTADLFLGRNYEKRYDKRYDSREPGEADHLVYDTNVPWQCVSAVL